MASEITERIKAIAMKECGSIAAFEKKIGLSNGTLQKAIQRGSDVGGNTIQTIVRTFNISPEWILTGIGRELKSGTSTLPEATEGQLLVYTAHGSITEAYNDEIPIEDRTYVSITGYTGADYRAFKIVGNSMTPLAYERDIVVAKRVTDPREISNGHVYVIAHQTDGVMCKRLYIHRKGSNFELECVSDNDMYDPHTYLADEFLEFWHVKAVLKFNLTKAVPDFVQLKKMQKELDVLKKKLHK
jgi:phage repressor protein C with HTH and peptisase S24 domain